ncbi:hypothetical protein CK811_07145 [Brucella abortus]|nr:hypothetical protein CK811_07145 [Brucella abortus]
MAEATAIAASGSKRLAVTICVMMATLMQALDSTIANVALPYMQGSLATTSSQVNWVLTSYIVAAAILTPATVHHLRCRFRYRFHAVRHGNQH